MEDLGTGNLLMPNVKMERYSAIGEMVMASPNPIPPNATLLDNGASVNVMKTLKGAILSTYVPDEPGDGISVGDENAELESNGSYVYANRYTDRNGAQVVMLIRASYCPGVICNIISEPVLVYQEKCSITFGGDGRVITMADGKRLCLSMTSNGLGWLKSDPITDDVTVLDMLDRKGDMVTSISTRLSTPITNVDDANLLEADDGDAQIEEIASSNNMYHLLDPILARCTSDVALALRQPLVASVGIDTISAPIDESIDISVDYAHLECEEIDQSISTALKEARLLANCTCTVVWLS